MTVTLQSTEAKIETSIDSRRCRRHRLILEVEAKDSSPTSSPVTVYDISNTGFLIETNSSFSVGETIEVKLPHVGFQRAEIVWTSGQLVGCKFTHALTQGAVSAARLEGAFPSAFDNKHRQSLGLELEAEYQNTDTSAEKLSLGVTLRVIMGLAALAWIFVLLIAFEISPGWHL